MWKTPRLEEWRQFAEHVLGLMPASAPDGSARFRIDDYPYRFQFDEADDPGIGAIGLQVSDDLALARLASQLEAAGHPVERATAADAAARSFTELVRVVDPAGRPVELVCGPVLPHTRCITPLVTRFVTEGLGFGHVVLGTSSFSDSVTFYRHLLGFRLRNTMSILRPGATEAVQLHFYGCNPRHHSLALLDTAIPGGLAHFMVEAETIDDVGAAFDRCEDAGIRIASRLGRHTNDQMLSFYCVAPDGPSVEFGTGGLLVDDATATTYQITKASFWGHRKPVEVAGA